jgi:hypothetical protein
MNEGRTRGSETPPTEQKPGRPTGFTNEDGLRAGEDHEDVPTEAPEEQGETPGTEYAPGGSL